MRYVRQKSNLSESISREAASDGSILSFAHYMRIAPGIENFARTFSKVYLFIVFVSRMLTRLFVRVSVGWFCRSSGACTAYALVRSQPPAVLSHAETAA